MRDFLVFALVLSSIPLILYRPYIGVLVWSWLAYMVPHRLAWGIANEFPFAQIVGITTIVAMVFSSDRRKVPFNRVTISWLLFILWMNVTTLYALVPDQAAIEWDRVMKIQLFSFVSLILIYGKDRINYLVAVIVASVGFYAVKGGLFAFSGGTGRVYGPPGGFFEENNSMGLAATMILPLMVYALSQIKRLPIRLAMFAAIALTILSILSTQSRGAFLAVAATVTFLWWQSKRKLKVGLLILIAAPVFYYSMPENWHERMATIATYEEDGSAQGRINAWNFAFNLATERPIVGGGFRTFDPRLFEIYAPVPDDYHDAHSIYFEMLGEHGFIGLFLFLALGIFSFRSAGYVVTVTAGQSELDWVNMLARMLQACLVAYATGGLFLGLAYWDLYYHFIVLIVLLRQHVDEIHVSKTASNTAA